MTSNVADIRERTGGQTLRRVVYSPEAIETRVAELAAEISAAYPPGDDLLLIGLLKGSFIFVADLVRRIARPVQVEFLVAASYGSGTTTSGEVDLRYDSHAELKGRHVVLVDDIVDSGTTLGKLIPLLRTREPKSLELCALLHKHKAADLVLEPRWVGFDAPDEFLIGYGLDYGENFRNLPFIASL